MPKEVWTFQSGTNPSVTTSGHFSSVTNLFRLDAFSNLFDHVAGNFPPDQPYPGIFRSDNPSSEGGIQPSWIRNIGQYVDVNKFNSASPPKAQNGDQAQIVNFAAVRSPLRGQTGGSYTPPPGLSNSSYPSLNGSGYFNQSYYHDLYIAMAHAIAVAQFSWMDDAVDDIIPLDVPIIECGIGQAPVPVSNAFAIIPFWSGHASEPIAAR